MDVERANGFTKFLASIVDYEHDQTDEEIDLWENLKVDEPVVNTFIVTLPSKKQYKIQVKPLIRE